MERGQIMTTEEKIGGRGSQLIKAAMLWSFFQSGRWICFTDLVEAFHCSEKTARRWIMALTEAGWPMTEKKEDRMMYFRKIKK